MCSFQYVSMHVRTEKQAQAAGICMCIHRNTGTAAEQYRMT
jgi:hypothetical protein